MTPNEPTRNVVPCDDDALKVYKKPLGNHTYLEWMSWSLWRIYNDYCAPKYRHDRSIFPAQNKLGGKDGAHNMPQRVTDWDD